MKEILIVLLFVLNIFFCEAKEPDRGYGTQAILDLYQCDTKLIDDIEWVRYILEKAAIIAGGTLVKSEFHKFNPYGISGVIIIQESHLAVHTWPEHKYVAIDIFTCSDKFRCQDAVDYVVDAFKPHFCRVDLFERGKK